MSVRSFISIIFRSKTSNLDQITMAEDDEIDILGDFTFENCHTRSDSILPSSSCSDLLQCDYTMNPQWLLDTGTTANWYENFQPDEILPRKSTSESSDGIVNTAVKNDWTNKERKLLLRGMEIYGRDAKCLSQFISTKSDVEVQLLIEQEYGINLDETPSVSGITTNMTNPKSELELIFSQASSSDDIPDPIEEVICIEARQHGDKLNYYEEDFSIAEALVGLEVPKKKSPEGKTHKSPQKITINGKSKVYLQSSQNNNNNTKFSIRNKMVKGKINNNIWKGSVKEKHPKPKMLIMTGSGHTLPLSRGEEVIKLDKSTDPESSSDVDVDIESDDAMSSSPRNDSNKGCNFEPKIVKQNQVEFIIKGKAISPLPTMSPPGNKSRNLDANSFTLRKRKKKLILDGEGGCTIKHSDLGDIYEFRLESKTNCPPKKQPIGLVYCKSYNQEHPAPYHIVITTTALLLMDVHAHTSRAEVMGLLGGKYRAELETLLIQHYAPCDSLENSGTHCDMCPVSQSLAYDSLSSKGCDVVGWYHSHPRFPPHPSVQDITSQIDMQLAFSKAETSGSIARFVGIIFSPHWAPGRTASQYKCLCVEKDKTKPTGEQDVAYRFRVNLQKDLDNKNVAQFLKSVEMLNLRIARLPKEFALNMAVDVCPDAKISYLNKCISSLHHHLLAAGYKEGDNYPRIILEGVRDIFR